MAQRKRKDNGVILDILIVCSIFMLIGALIAVASAAANAMKGVLVGAVFMIVGFFTGVIAILVTA
jgi:hypothetical protein